VGRVSAVRPEYARLARDFVRLAKMFDVALDAQAQRDVTTLAACIEWVDRVMDAMPLRVDRERMGARALAALVRGTEEHPTLTALREVLVRRNVVDAFARAVASELEVGESMRDARDANAFVAHVTREGVLTTDMALLVSGLATHRTFAVFFRRLGEPANLVDKLLDMREDHARGEMHLRPTLRLHARIASEIVRRLPALLACSPRPVWVLAWGASYLDLSTSRRRA
jgi:hypothetical protein